MRISALALVLACVACGSATPTNRPGSCAAYVQAVRAPLARMGRAADAFGARVGGGPDAAAAASSELAARLDEEHGKLAIVRADRQDIADAHVRMLAALAGLADALRYLADVVSRRDEAHRGDARRRFHDAETGWQSAIAEVKKACPDSALP
jgi:hypothetical protein